MKKPTIDQMSAELRANGKAKFLEGSTEKRRLYHGTSKDFSKFNPKKSFGNLGLSWLTADPKFSEYYTHKTGQIMPVHAQVKNTFDFSNREHLDKLKQKTQGKKYYDTVRGMRDVSELVPEHKPEGEDNYRDAEHPELFKAIKNMGHDSVYVTERGQKSLGVFNPKRIKSATGNRGTYDINDPDITKAKGGIIHKAEGGAARKATTMGINVASDRKAGMSYADLIVDGHKTHESRNSDSLRPYVGKRVSIVRTGEGAAKAIGEVTVGAPIVVNKKKFRSMEPQHLVPEGSAFDIKTETKHLYPMHDPVRYDEERDVGHGIVARKVIHKADGGTIQGNKMDTPTLAQMRVQLNQRKNPNFIDSVGIEEAVDMDPKKYINPNPRQGGGLPVGGVADRNGLPVGGVDQDNTQPGQQMMTQQPNQLGQQQQQADLSNQTGFEPDGGSPQGPQQPMGNMLSMTPQGQALQAMSPNKPQAMAKGGSAYAKTPHSLMGFKKQEPHKQFNESNYKHTAYVKVHHGTDQHVDAIKGLNHSHAMARAKLNWPTATRIEGISEQEAGKIDPDVVKMAKGGKVNPKQMAAIKAKMMMGMRPKKYAEGGNVDAPYSETNNPGRVLFHGKGHGQTKGIIVPRHMWEGSEGVYDKGEKKGQPFKNEGMRDLNKARAEVYGTENRAPLTIGQVNRTHKNVLDEHFAKPLKEQIAAENEALGRLRKAKHIGKNANTLDKSEKLDTVKHELDDEGRSHVGFASKGVAGHSLYTSGHGKNAEHHVINTCPGQTVGCGGGHDENGIIDTMKGTCFAPNAESQYVNASVRRAAHEQAKHDPKMTRDWILAHTGSLRKVSETADKNNERTLFRPNVVDETDTSSRHVIRHLNKQRKVKDKPPIIANSYGKTNELHDPENGYFVTHSNVGPKVKHGKSIAENIARDKQRVRSTVTATEANGKDFENEEGNKTPPKGSYMVTDVKRKSPMQKEMEKHITHAKYWSTGRPVNELSKEEKAEEEEGHFDGNGKPTTEDKAHFGHISFDGKRYDYQKQHILHPRLVNVPERKKNAKTKQMETVEHMIPTDSRFMDESFLPKKRFKTKNGKLAGHILMTTPTESTSNVGHETSFTHHVGEHSIDYAKRNKGEYEIDSPMHQAMAEGKEYVKPEPIKIVRKVKAVKKAEGGRVEFTPHDYDDDFNCFPERNYIAQHHLANRAGVEDETELPESLLRRPKD